MKKRKSKTPSAKTKKKNVTRTYKRSSYVKKVENVLDITVSDDSGKTQNDEATDKTDPMVDKKTSGTSKFAKPIREPYPTGTRAAIGFKSVKTKKNKPKK